MSTYEQRDIVLVPFPFSDLSQQKVRPVLILSRDDYNRQSADVVVCGLTTNLTPAPYSVIADVTDVEQPGTLRHKSRIKVNALASLEQSILIKQVARLKEEVFAQVVTEIHSLTRTTRLRLRSTTWAGAPRSRSGAPARRGLRSDRRLRGPRQRRAAGDGAVARSEERVFPGHLTPA